MAAKFNDFSELAQRVWAATPVEKLTVVNEMITACISNDQKKTMFRREVRLMTPSRLDRFASDLMLVADNKVIR